MATPNEIRIVGLELSDDITALKTAVDAINTVVSAWNLKSIDGDLPAGSAVKAQLTAYNAISKPTMSLSDAITAIQAVE